MAKVGRRVHVIDGRRDVIAGLFGRVFLFFFAHFFSRKLLYQIFLTGFLPSSYQNLTASVPGSPRLLTSFAPAPCWALTEVW